MSLLTHSLCEYSPVTVSYQHWIKGYGKPSAGTLCPLFKKKNMLESPNSQVISWFLHISYLILNDRNCPKSCY